MPLISYPENKTSKSLDRNVYTERLLGLAVFMQIKKDLVY